MTNQQSDEWASPSYDTAVPLAHFFRIKPPAEQVIHPIHVQTNGDSDVEQDTSWRYEYVYGANGITTVTTFGHNDSSWYDLLTSVNNTPITHDAVGNPLSDGTWTYTWQAGRQLKQMTKTGETVSFEYNDEGLRVRKTATSTGVTEYTLHGKQVVHLKNTASDNTVTEMHFYYGSDGRPAFVRMGADWYAYVYNLQGDVIALTDSTGAVVVEYGYDAWGKALAVTGTLAGTLGVLQPFRYRGYVWDEETGLYYLRSRYYRAEWCRFVSADALIKGNLYRYCDNSPIILSDQSGKDGDNALLDKPLALRPEYAYLVDQGLVTCADIT